MLIECIPNVSEGRRPEIVAAMADAIRRVAGVRLLDFSSDASHNRSVFTFAGDPVGVEEASANPARKNLEDIRRGEFEGLAAKMATAGWAPDYGPAAPHPTAGAMVVGARMALIAYNINLATNRLDVAKKIAAAIRHSSGGFRYVKAAGFTLEDRGIVQVSMNLTNYEKTPIFRVFEAVKREAARHGVAILESEIVGLVPSAALTAAAEFYLQIDGFKADQVLENKLREMT